MAEKWKFEFVIEGLSEPEADHILYQIIKMTEGLGGEVDGGFLPVEEVPDEPKNVV